MQTELKSLERRWGLAVQTARFGVWDLDPVAHLVHYSPEWKAMLGYDATDTPDATATWRARVHPDDLPVMLDRLTAHLEGRSEAYEAEFRVRAADGSYRWVLSRGRVVERTADGAARRVVGTMTDVTDRHELEALRQQRDRAEAANQAKTEFLSRMSHELRTPLNAVLGFAQLLVGRLGPHDPEGQRQARHIEQAGWHLLAMVNDVLDLARAETGQLGLVIEPVAVAPLWNEVATMMAPLAGPRHIALRTGVLPAEAVVRADRTRLKQVLTNLASNAVKYNRDGGVVTLDARRVDGQWHVALSDTGIGMNPAQLAHLFEPFNRLGRAGSGVEGVGIGLVLTRWLVVQMGGTLALRSAADVGTTAEVTLPAA
jgi:PAS domain S-box-containing protein